MQSDARMGMPLHTYGCYVDKLLPMRFLRLGIFYQTAPKN